MNLQWKVREKEHENVDEKCTTVIVAFKMQSDDNLISLEDVEEIVIEEERIASGSNFINNAKEDDEECENIESEEEGCEDESSPIYVPNDPKTWTEKNIEMWIKWATDQFKLKPPLDASRFPKSGDVLAKFTKADFYVSCASFVGGKSVAQHFKYLIESIGGKYDETLDIEGDPGKIIYFNSNKKSF